MPAGERHEARDAGGARDDEEERALVLLVRGLQAAERQVGGDADRVARDERDPAALRASGVAASRRPTVAMHTGRCGTRRFVRPAGTRNVRGARGDGAGGWRLD